MWKLKLPEGPVGLSSDGGRDPLYPGVSGGQ